MRRFSKISNSHQRVCLWNYNKRNVTKIKAKQTTKPNIKIIRGTKDDATLKITLKELQAISNEAARSNVNRATNVPSNQRDETFSPALIARELAQGQILNGVIRGLHKMVVHEWDGNISLEMKTIGKY